jgi:hypothetical protein
MRVVLGAFILWVIGNQLCPHSIRCHRRHDAKETLAPLNREYLPDRLDDLACRKLGQRPLHGGYQLFVGQHFCNI